jgi:hypothetical protein
LELKYFQTNQGEVVLPQLYGAAEVPRERPEGPVWDEARFFTRAEEALEDPKTLGILRDLYLFLREHGYQVKWGKRGTREGRAVFCLPDPDAKDGFITVLRLKTDGTMKLGLGRLPSEIGPEQAVVIARKLLKTINVPAIQKWADESFFLDERTLKSGWPGGGKRINTLLPDAQAVKQFKDELLAFADRGGQ